MRLFRTLACAAASLAVLAATSAANANGRYPAAGQIALSPADPNTVLVRATYGILLTKNAGQKWSWICEAAVGYGGFEDPMVSFTSDGTILAGIFEGLSVSNDQGCQWDFAPGGLANKYVIDVAVDKVDPSKGVLIISNSDGQDDAGAPVFLTQLWQTSDNGKTWAQAGVDLPPSFLGLTVDTAPSNPDRVYASGRLGPPSYPGVLQRSDDRGAHWTQLTIPGADDTHLPYIGAVDPQNPDVVYVRLDSDPVDQLLVSRDGGTTWTKVFDTMGNMNGFALSPDGSKVAIGGDKDGIWTAPTDTLSFTQQSNVGARCLTWSSAGLYACADEFVDKFTAGISSDEGKTFTPIMHLDALCGPLECPSTTPVGQQCPALWGPVQVTINAQSCDTGSSTSGGSTSSSGAGGGGGSGGGSASSSCALPASAGGSAAAAFLMIAAATLATARRKRR